MDNKDLKFRLVEARRLMDEGRVCDSISIVVFVILEARKLHDEGLLNTSTLLDLYQSAYDGLQVVNCSSAQAMEDLGQAYFYLGKLSDSIAPVKHVSAQALGHADDCGWTDKRQKTHRIYLSVFDSDFTEATAVLSRRAAEDPYAWLLLARIASPAQELVELEEIIGNIPKSAACFVAGQLLLAELKQQGMNYYGAEDCFASALNVEPWNNLIRQELQRNRVLIATGENLGWQITSYLVLEDAVDALITDLKEASP
jgi:hypothetical protein